MKYRVWHLMLAIFIFQAIVILGSVQLGKVIKRKFYQCCSSDVCLEQHHHEVK